MIFSCTNKVVNKIKSVQQVSAEKHELHFNNWYVNQLILQRKAYFLFTNSTSLFSFISYMGTKKEHKQMGKLFTATLKEQLVREYGHNQKYLDLVASNAQEFEFCKTNSRSILGSMNDFKFSIEHHAYHRGMSKNTINFINNSLVRTPMTIIGISKDRFNYPNEVHKSMLDKLIS